MSMNREEAINRIENHMEVHGIGEYPHIALKEALDMAITALRPVSREQVEKVWRGEWNYSHKTKIDGFDVVQCSKCGQEALTLALYVKNGNFCPYCGAPMTDEAVDIVMRRLEELKDGL